VTAVGERPLPIRPPASLVGAATAPRSRAERRRVSPSLAGDAGHRDRLAAEPRWLVLQRTPRGPQPTSSRPARSRGVTRWDYECLAPFHWRCTRTLSRSSTASVAGSDARASTIRSPPVDRPPRTAPATMVRSATGLRVAEKVSAPFSTRASTRSSRVACQTSASRRLQVRKAVRVTRAAHGRRTAPK
jgi:hypothetical protein